MRESRSSGSVEGVMGNHDSYSDSEGMSIAIVSMLGYLRSDVLASGEHPK